MFNYDLDWMVNKTQTGWNGLQVGRTCWASGLVYVDDIPIFGVRCEAAQKTRILINDQTHAVDRKSNPKM